MGLQSPFGQSIPSLSAVLPPWPHLQSGRLRCLPREDYSPAQCVRKYKSRPTHAAFWVSHCTTGASFRRFATIARPLHASRCLEFAFQCTEGMQVAFDLKDISVSLPPRPSEHSRRFPFRRPVEAASVIEGHVELNLQSSSTGHRDTPKALIDLS